MILQGPDLVSFLHWSTSPCTILFSAFLATLVSIEPTLMLELWTLLPAMARLAPITIGSYIFRSPKLICARSKLILATSTSKYRKNCLRNTLRRWKKSRKRDLGLGYISLISFFLYGIRKPNWLLHDSSNLMLSISVHYFIYISLLI